MASTASSLVFSLPPPATAGPAISRSELIANRRVETAYQLQSRFDQWESSNPSWAQRLTGPDAAAALGYVGERVCKFATRRDMIHARRLASRQAAMEASGFDDETKAKLSTPAPMATSIARPTVDPSTKWVDTPAVKCRSQLRNERRADNVLALDAATERNERMGILGAEARVQRRIDQSIAYLQEAGPSKSRAQLLATRRRERAEASQFSYDTANREVPPQYSAHGEPFWKVDRAHERAQPPMEEVGSDPGGGCSAPPLAVVGAFLPETGGGSKCHLTASAMKKATLPSGAVSAEIVNTHRRFWVKPERYPKVCPELPLSADPFKITAAETRYLHGKLSSGPKKEQRGYPPEAAHIAVRPPASNAVVLTKDGETCRPPLPPTCLICPCQSAMP